MRLVRSVQHALLATGGLLPLALSSTAFAQSGASSGFELEEITITATKRETSLQETPISITALEGEDIQKSGRTSLAQILQNVAGVEANTAGNFGQYFWIRGIGSSPTFGQDSAVTVSVNGVFQQMAQSARGSFLDVDRVEVARGPQSTLNGRNALGGSVSIIGAEPKLDYEGTATVGAGNLHDLNGQLVLNAPIGEIMAVRGAMSMEKRDGLLSNGTTDTDVLAGRLRWMIKPSDAFKLILSADVQRTGGKGIGSADSGLIIPNQTTAFGLGRTCYTAAQCATAVQTIGASAGQAGAGFSSLPYVQNNYTSYAASDPYSRKFKSNTFYADLTWDLGFAQLYVQPTYMQSDAIDFNSTFSLLNYAQWAERINRLHGATPPATSAAPVATQCGPAGTICNTWSTERIEQLARVLASGINWNHLRQDQKTFEARLSSPADSKLDWLGGLYYFRNDEKVRTSVTAGGTNGVYSLDAFGGPTPVNYCSTPSTASGTAPFGTGCAAIGGIPAGAFSGSVAIPNDATGVVRSFSTDPGLMDALSSFRAGIDPRRYTTDYAGYAQVKYPFTDDLRLTVGGRYTRETKWRAAEPARNTYRVDNGIAGTATGVLQSAPMLEQKITWNIADFRATLDYNITPESMVYGSVSTGFRGGAFQNLPVDANNVLLPGFKNYYDPEKLISYEIGSRNDFFGKRLRLNASAYYYDYRDYQYQYNALIYTGQDPDALIAYTTNVGKASSYGIDLESRFLLTPNDDFSLNGTYTKSKLGSFNLPGGNAAAIAAAAALKGQAFRRSPKWTAIPRYAHRFDLGGLGAITAEADAHFESSSFVNNANPDANINQLITQPSYHLLNASLSYDSSDGKLNISAFVRNIQDEFTIGTVMAPNAYNATVANMTFDPGEPRTYGMTITTKF